MPRQSGSYSSSSPLPDPLVPQPTSTSTKAAKQSSIKGLQELCKGLFWSTEDLSIPVQNKTEGEGELAIDSPWCTSDLANVHSRLKQLEESSQETLKEAANLSSGSNITAKVRGEWRSEGDFGRNEDTSIRVFASNDAEIHTELSSTSYDTDEAAAYILTDDGRSIEVTADTRDELSEEAGNVSKEEGDGNLVCPICGVEYERNPENARKLVLHVDEHLIDELKCPICSIAFSVRNQNAYENHVNTHFNDANDFVEVGSEQTNQASAPTTVNTENEESDRPRFWFVDNID